MALRQHIPLVSFILVVVVVAYMVNVFAAILGPSPLYNSWLWVIIEILTTWLVAAWWDDGKSKFEQVQRNRLPRSRTRNVDRSVQMRGGLALACGLITLADVFLIVSFHVDFPGRAIKDWVGGYTHPTIVPRTHDTIINASLVSPSAFAIESQLNNIVEVRDPAVMLSIESDPLTISDGQGGSLTAAIGGKFRSADGFGQLLVFWHGKDYIGWNTPYLSTYIHLSSTAPGVFVARFAQYQSNDAICCPSLPPAIILYRWDGTRIIASSTPPVFGKQLLVTPLL